MARLRQRGRELFKRLGAESSSTFAVVTSRLSGHTIEAEVAAANAGGSASAASPATALIQAPTGSGTPSSTGAPVIRGTAAEGDPLTATVGTWSGAPDSYAFQWEDCNGSGESCSDVESGTGTSSVYVPTANDVGHTLAVDVTAGNGPDPEAQAQRRRRS